MTVAVEHFALPPCKAIRSPTARLTDPDRAAAAGVFRDTWAGLSHGFGKVVGRSEAPNQRRGIRGATHRLYLVLTMVFSD
jgi:hypothetical protein